jgi:hypothetical protein
MVAAEGELTSTTASISVAPSADAIPLKLRRSGGTPRQVFAIALIGTLVLAVFASRDLATWLDRVGDGPVLVPLQHAAADWDDTMATLGLVRPHEAFRFAIRRLLDWRWPERAV